MITFKNLADKVELTHIQIASDLLKSQGIRHVLIGSAALKLYNMLPTGYVAEDIDFLVDKAPYVKDPLPKEKASVSDSVAVMIDGVKCDFVLTNFSSKNQRMRKFFTKDPSIFFNVPVADLSDILGLKLSAARTKDFEFIAAWMRKYGEIPKSKPTAPFWKRLFT